MFSLATSTPSWRLEKTARYTRACAFVGHGKQDERTVVAINPGSLIEP